MHIEFSSAAPASDATLAFTVEKDGMARLTSSLVEASALDLLILLVFHFILTLVALKLAFKYWEMDAFWSGTFAIAGIDTAVRGLMEWLDPITGGFTTLGHVDAAVAWGVMIVTIRRFCFNKRIQDAMLTASAVKVLVTILTIFGSVALLGLLKGMAG